MKTFKQFCNLNEDGEAPANSVGGGMSPVVGNEGGIKGYDKLLNRGKVLRRKPLMTGLKPRKK